MTSLFRLAPAAQRDIEELVGFLADSGEPDTAHRLLDRLEAVLVGLAEMPAKGHAREDLTDEGVLFWRFFAYLIVYRPRTEPLEVVRVLHAGRDVERELRRLTGGRNESSSTP